ncbi:MAG: hypothetical protein RMX96_10645 [Nostoc sp. ChiSLP02]|nr:hypothetical protein [Nostoc sp. DedSLP05]MDZ8101422.1 hypothetical protein [Nostoc sp. DedSLP01]MDZ8185298.1 hypothetical protein [Nostoc sp. ChiSLP02]
MLVIKRLLPQLARWQSTVLYLLLWYAIESLVQISDRQEPPTIPEGRRQEAEGRR